MPSNDTILDEENGADVIHSILNGSPFKIRPDDEKLAILEKGRPLYNLNIVRRDLSKDYSRNFHSSFYNIHKWLCGSKSLNKLFCWPCLLMRPESSSWCSIGNDDMKRFTSLATKHARCKSHLKAVYEYDETLKNFGLPPEFISELKFRCKEEEEEASLSDKIEVDDEIGKTYFQKTGREKMNDKCKLKVKQCAKESDKVYHISNINKKITFKAWQEMCEDNFCVSKSRFFEDFQLYKWKKKIARQELKNARLVGEKLKFEIEVLKAKIEYHKAFRQNMFGTNSETFMPATSSEVSQN